LPTLDCGPLRGLKDRVGKKLNRSSGVEQRPWAKAKGESVVWGWGNGEQNN